MVVAKNPSVMPFAILGMSEFQSSAASVAVEKVPEVGIAYGRSSHAARNQLLAASVRIDC